MYGSGKGFVEVSRGGEGGAELGGVGAASDGEVRGKGVGAGEVGFQDAGIKLVVDGDELVVAAFDVEKEVFVGVSGDGLQSDGKGWERGGDGVDVVLELRGGEVAVKGKDEGEVGRDKVGERVELLAEGFDAGERCKLRGDNDGASGHGCLSLISLRLVRATARRRGRRARW